ncbi:MAG: LEA type 2 family protein [Bacteroidota bacterium]
MKINLSIICFAFCSFLLAFVGCNGPQNPTFKGMQNVKFKSASFGEGFNVRLSGDAILENPNSFGITVTGLDLDVFAEDKKMSRVEQDVSASIGANSDFSLPIILDIPLKELAGHLEKPKNFNLLKKKEVKIKLEGYIIVSAAGVNIRVPMTYEEPYELSLMSLFGG